MANLLRFRYNTVQFGAGVRFDLLTVIATGLANLSVTDRKKILKSMSTFDSHGRLVCSPERLHKLVQQKLLGKIATGQGMRGAFKVFGPSPDGIGLKRFRQMLTGIGVTLNDNDALRLFSKYDSDGSGHIDMYELMRNVLPKDYEGRTWQAKNYEKEIQHRAGKNSERKKLGPKYHTATHYPKGLRETMEPTVKDVEKMIRFKIESNARDGCERDYALKMFGRPLNGISRPNLQRALLRNSIPCSDHALDDIFDSLQVCGLVNFDRLWHRVMPVDGRVRIGVQSNPSGLLSKHLNQSKRKKKKRKKEKRIDTNLFSDTRNEDQRVIKPNRASSSGMMSSSQSLPSLTSKKSRTYSYPEVKRILKERISSHHNAENFSFNSFERKMEISFQVFCAGLKRLGVPASKAQANMLFKQYDRDTGLVNHRGFFRDVVDPQQQQGWQQRRGNAALRNQQRGWTPAEDRGRRFPEVNIRTVTPGAMEAETKKHQRKAAQHRQHTNKTSSQSRTNIKGKNTSAAEAFVMQKKRRKKKTRKKVKSTCPW